MPAFTSLAEADAWRAVHAPARKPRETSEKKPVEIGKKNARFSETTRDGTTKGAAQDPKAAEEAWPPAPPPPPERINVAAMIDANADFDALMIKHAEAAPQIAYGLLLRKMESGEPGAISAATKNWHETSKAAADVRERFVTVQKQTRSLIHLDDVFDVLGVELQDVRSRLSKLGARVAAFANPENPSLAQQVIDAGVDDILSKFFLVQERAALELKRDDQDAAAS